ncbi:pilus assembly protein CpaB [Rhodobacter viridis]|uniref:Pilus assembly protein CpaB n=2 Tax=Rhodobacter viridis TaxID=1054202 RepID=A0A318U0Y9_9RHOB|nr:pilus assembly protein CpaB [Rhodobacter viridis]
MIVALVLVLGVALAGAAVYMAQQQISQFQNERDMLVAEQANAPKLVDVVILRRALAYGERFTAADLGVIKMQEGHLPEGIFHLVATPLGAPEEALAASVFPGGETRPRAALRSYDAYEAILANKITAPGVDAGIMANLSPNMRAFTISVNATTGVSGFLRPGDRVDVYWSGEVNGERVTKLIDTSLRLIAIDQSADADRSEETKVAATVTAEVTPEQVAALTLAQGTGELTLSLVGMQNTSDPGAIEIDRNKLLGIQAQEAVKVEAERVCTVKMRKGTELVETPIPCKN